MEKGTRVRPAYLRHRCNSQREIDSALEAGFDGVEVDVVWGSGLGVENSAPIILGHEHHGEGPNFFDIDFHGCIVAINVKEYGMAGVLSNVALNPTTKDHFLFDIPGPELDLYCAAGARIFGRFSQWENQTLMPQVEGALLDDFTGTSEGQGALMLRTSRPVALISNQLRGGADSRWVLRAAQYVICKEKV